MDPRLEGMALRQANMRILRCDGSLPTRRVPRACSVAVDVSSEVDHQQMRGHTVQPEEVQNGESVAELIVATKPIAFWLDAEGSLRCVQRRTNLTQAAFCFGSTTRFDLTAVRLRFD